MSSSSVGPVSNRNLKLSGLPIGGKIEDDEWLERVDHPLLNDVILKLVLENVRRYDLKNCRGVCKKWNEYTLPHIRSTFEVTIHGQRSREENVETRRIVDFVKLFKSNELGIPFEKYRLGPFRTTDGAGKQFLEICGEFIKEIVLLQPERGYYVRTIENLTALLKFSPNLEALTLSGQFVSRSRNIVKLFPDSRPSFDGLKKLSLNHDCRKSPIKYCPTFFDELLSAASNVFDVAIDDLGPACLYDPEIGTNTFVLESIERLGSSTLQYLSLENASEDDVRILRKMVEKPNGLKLNGVRFRPHIEDPNSTVLVDLAIIFKDTLECFCVPEGLLRIPFMELPKMSNLKSYRSNVMMELRDEHVELNQNFPVIETFDVIYVDDEYESDDEEYEPERIELFPHFQICPSLKNLILSRNFISMNTFQNILRVFPNLRKLTLKPFGDEADQVLEQLWTHMTQLESLSLLASVEREGMHVRLLDSLITGISIERLDEIHNFIPSFKEMTAEGRRERITFLLQDHGTQNTQKPSIRNLTKLRHLDLTVSTTNMTRNFDPTDLSGYFGIFFLKKLRSLDISECNFSRACCEILKIETGVEEWSFQTETDYNDNGMSSSFHVIPPFHIPAEKDFTYNGKMKYTTSNLS